MNLQPNLNNLKKTNMKKILLFLLFSASIYGQTSTALKAQIDTDITNKTGAGSISKSNVGNNMKDIVDYVDQQIPYKSYHAILTQTGSTASVTVLSENLLQPVTFTVNSAGNYSFDSIGSFAVGKTVLFKGAPSSGSGKDNIQFQTSGGGNGIDKVSMYVYNSSGVLSDAVFVNLPIEIRVFN